MLNDTLYYYYTNPNKVINSLHLEKEDYRLTPEGLFSMLNVNNVHYEWHYDYKRRPDMILKIPRDQQMATSLYEDKKIDTSETYGEQVVFYYGKNSNRVEALLHGICSFPIDNQHRSNSLVKDAILGSKMILKPVFSEELPRPFGRNSLKGGVYYFAYRRIHFTYEGNRIVKDEREGMSSPNSHVKVQSRYFYRADGKVSKINTYTNTSKNPELLYSVEYTYY